MRFMERFDDFVCRLDKPALLGLIRLFELLLVIFLCLTTVLAVATLAGEDGGRPVDFLGDRVERKEKAENKPADNKPAESRPTESSPTDTKVIEEASAPPEPVNPPTPAAGPNSGADLAGFTEHRPDIRPVITAYVRPNCPPCAAFKTWETANRGTSPLRFEILLAPGDVATPSFRWQDATGKLWKPREDGWKGQETANAILRDYRATVPGLKFDPGAAERTGKATASGPGGVGGSEDILALARRFAGTRGKLIFAPEKPVVADVKGDGSVVLEFAELNATYDLTGDNPTIRFEQPVPGGTYTAWGWGVGFKLNQIAYAPPPVNELLVGTNWKELRFKFSVGGEVGQ